MVNVNTFSTTSIICLEIEITVKDEISEGRQIQVVTRLFEVDTDLS